MRLGGFTLLALLMVGASCGSTETPAPTTPSTPGIPSASPSPSSAPAAVPEFTKTCTEGKAIDLSGDDPFHVSVHNFRFVPGCYIVSLASSSVVTNKDDVAHTFTIDGTLVNAPWLRTTRTGMDRPRDSWSLVPISSIARSIRG